MAGPQLSEAQTEQIETSQGLAPIVDNSAGFMKRVGNIIVTYFKGEIQTHRKFLKVCINFANEVTAGCTLVAPYCPAQGTEVNISSRLSPDGFAVSNSICQTCPARFIPGHKLIRCPNNAELAKMDSISQSSLPI